MRPYSLLAVAALALAPRTLPAQSCFARTCQGTNTVVATVGALLKLTLDRSPTVTANPTAQDIAAGYQDVAGPSARVRSNTDWRLEVSSASATWDAAAGRNDKPATDLELRAGAEQYAPMSTTPTVAAVGTATHETDVATAYRARFDRQDNPGSYSVVVRYTLTTR